MQELGWVEQCQTQFFSVAEQRHIHESFIWLKNGNSPQNEDKFEYYPDLKNEDYLKNWDIPQKTT